MYIEDLVAIYTIATYCILITNTTSPIYYYQPFTSSYQSRVGATESL